MCHAYIDIILSGSQFYKRKLGKRSSLSQRSGKQYFTQQPMIVLRLKTIFTISRAFCRLNDEVELSIKECIFHYFNNAQDHNVKQHTKDTTVR